MPLNGAGKKVMELAEEAEEDSGREGEGNREGEGGEVHSDRI